MKRIRAAFRKLVRSEVDDQIDRLKTESRAEVARMIKEGRGREGLEKNAELLGLQRNGSTPKMIFGSKPAGARKRGKK